MKYKGKELVLDNFRKELNGYSLDVQDVVRSAILDGKDISMYIEQCKNSAYRLDQIRLGMKEGISSVFFEVRSGELIYRIRQLIDRGKDLSRLEWQIKKGVVTEENLGTLVSWLEKDYVISDLDISIIPKSMLGIFDYGLSKGFNMSMFNNGRVYTSEYVRLCLTLMENSKDPFQFIEGKLWDISVMKALVGYSKSADAEKWGNLLKFVSAETPKGKVKQLIRCVNNSMSIKELGKPEWSEGAIDIVLKALSEGLDFKSLISVGPEADAVVVKYNELSLRKTKEHRVGGILKKSYRG